MRELPTALTVIKYIAHSRGILKGGEGYLTKYRIIELCEKWLATRGRRQMDEPPDQCPDCGTRYPCKPGCPAMLLGPYTEDPENKALMGRLKQNHAIRTRRKPKGECSFCDEHYGNQMMPSHDASSDCESGKHSHCTCDTCF